MQDETKERIRNFTKEVIYNNNIIMPNVISSVEFPIVRRVKWQAFAYFFNGWAKFSDLPMATKQTIITDIEQSFYMHTCSLAQERNIPQDWENENFIELYHGLCAEVLSNIDINGVANAALVMNIIDNTINIEQLPKLSASELYPSKYADILSRIEQAKNVNTTIRTSKMYTCRRCKRSECKIENRYNRSLDEGTNLSITCMACGNQWNA